MPLLSLAVPQDVRGRRASLGVGFGGCRDASKHTGFSQDIQENGGSYASLPSEASYPASWHAQRGASGSGDRGAEARMQAMDIDEYQRPLPGVETTTQRLRKALDELHFDDNPQAHPAAHPAPPRHQAPQARPQQKKRKGQSKGQNKGKGKGKSKSKARAPLVQARPSTGRMLSPQEYWQQQQRQQQQQMMSQQFMKGSKRPLETIGKGGGMMKGMMGLKKGTTMTTGCPLKGMKGGMKGMNMTTGMGPTMTGQGMRKGKGQGGGMMKGMMKGMHLPVGGMALQSNPRMRSSSSSNNMTPAAWPMTIVINPYAPY